MSKYIPGAVDYIAQVQPYQPDFNFFNQVLETKQSQYKAGYDKLSNLYGTLLQSQMLRPEDIELRNKFFNQIGSEISKISGMDLSLAQNVQAASQVFQPLIDNDYIMKDMAYTKQAYNELDRAERLRTCTDPKTCGDQYWEGGVKAVQYQMQDFAKSSADESLNYSAPKYTPFVNVPKKAMQFAKDMGFSMQNVSWTPDNKFIVTTKNGVAMIPSLTDAFVSAFRNDQPAIDYYKTKAYLDMKDTASSSAEKFGSMEAAENDYLVRMSKVLFDQNAERSQQADANYNAVQNKKGALENIISQKGVDLNNPTDKKIANAYGQSLLEEIMAAGAKEHFEETKQIVEPDAVQNADKANLQYRVNMAMANNLFMNDLEQTAYSYAMNTSETSIKEDPYALKSFSANLDHALAIDRMDKEHRYKNKEMRTKATYDMLIEGYKQGEVDMKGNKKAPKVDPSSGRSANSEANKYLTVSGATGNVAKEKDLQNFDKESFSTTSQGRMSADYELMKDVHSRLVDIAGKKPGESVVLGDDGISVVLDEKTIQAAKDKLASIFNYGTEEPIVTNEGGWVEQSWAWLKRKSGYDPTATANTWSIKHYGGVLKKDGSMPSEAEIQANPDWHNPNSKDNWFAVNQKLMEFVSNDGLGMAIVNGNPKTQELKTKSKIANDAYFRALEDQRFNNKGVHITLTESKTIMESAVGNTYNPKFSQSFLANNYTDPTGNVTGKDAFVNKYVNDYLAQNGLKDPRTGMQMVNASVETDWMGRPVSIEDRLRDDAETMYDQWSKTFVESYNQSEDVPTFADQRIINEGYTLSSMKGGGVQADPIRIDGGDSAAWGDLIAKDSRDIIGLTKRLVNDEAKQVSIIPMDGLKINEDTFDDYKLTQDEGAIKAMNMIYQDLMTGNSTEDRAQWSLTVHPVIGAQRGKVGYTFELGERFAGSSQGSDTTPGRLRGAPSTFTIVMDEKDASDLDVSKRRERGPYSLMWNGTDPIVIDEFAETGGYMKMSPSPYADGGILTEGYLNYYDDDMTSRKAYFKEITPKEVTPDSLVSKWGASIIQSSMLYSQQAAELKQMGNPIKNVSDLQPK